jgi:molecular chaperone DnaK
MKELGDDKLQAGEKEAIENAIKELEEAMKGDDKAAIEAKTTALTEASAKMAERLYSQQAGAQPGGGEESAGGSQAKGDGGKSDDDVVDAEFEEVKDDKK